MKDKKIWISADEIASETSGGKKSVDTGATYDDSPEKDFRLKLKI